MINPIFPLISTFFIDGDGNDDNNKYSSRQHPRKWMVLSNIAHSEKLKPALTTIWIRSPYFGTYFS
jgi:hypothetical protein